MKLNILYLYPKLLNLYGDQGNVEILSKRAQARGYEVEVLGVGIGSKMDGGLMKKTNIVFMGGGPDSKQKEIYQDLIKEKGSYLKEYIEQGGFGLYICGSYQLLGRYYKSADGSVLQGLGVFDLYTKHFGNKKPRCIGNTVAKISPVLLNNEIFNRVNNIGDTIVGFENHGGHTYLGNPSESLAQILRGHGNNSEDGTEGILYKNSLGTYFHGPVLSKNSHLADYLIAASLGVNNLSRLNDSLIISAHTASKRLKQ